MSFACTSVPVLVMLGFNALGIRPSSVIAKKIFEVASVSLALGMAFPISAAIFHPTSKLSADGHDLDHHNREVYFAKGS